MPIPADPSGFLLVAKPSGMTSFDVVRRVRRLLGIRKLGHSGVLDRPAMGLLVLGAGQATRLFELFSGFEKEYEADIWLGLQTTTDDLAGDLLPPGASAVNPNSLTAQQIQQSLAAQVGELDQLPPAFSLTKVQGKELYRYALVGDIPQPAPKRVTIDSIAVMEDEPLAGLAAASLPEDSRLNLHQVQGLPLRCLAIRMRCRGGVYVRSVARDLGIALGCGGCVGRLVRTRVGPFALDTAWDLAELEAVPPESVSLLPLSSVAASGALFLTASEVEQLRQGKPIVRSREQLPEPLAGEQLLGLAPARDSDPPELVAMLAVAASGEPAELRPRKVFRIVHPLACARAGGG